MLKKKMVALVMTAVMAGSLGGGVNAVYAAQAGDSATGKPAWQILSLIRVMSRRKTAIKSTVPIKISIAGMTQLKPVLTPQ